MELVAVAAIGLCCTAILVIDLKAIRRLLAEVLHELRKRGD